MMELSLVRKEVYGNCFRGREDETKMELLADCVDDGQIKDRTTVVWKCCARENWPDPNKKGIANKKMKFRAQGGLQRRSYFYK